MMSAVYDIAVDGWALMMLKRRNIGYLASCEATGVSLGFVVGYICLLVLGSSEFCNKYIFTESQAEGIITLGAYMKFWSLVIIITTIFIAIYKREVHDERLAENLNYGIKAAYVLMWKILKLRPIMQLILFLLTARLSFGACDSISLLKLIEYGVPKDKIALLAIFMIPFHILVPLAISRMVAKKFPMKFNIKTYRIRLSMMIVLVAFVYFTPNMLDVDNDAGIPLKYFIGLFTIHLLYHVRWKIHFYFTISILSPLICRAQ
jgi:PAT family acetyl-CoA transporter-like MFS transporter 1